MHKAVFVIRMRENSGIRVVQSLIDRDIVVDLNHEDTDHCVMHKAKVCFRKEETITQTLVDDKLYNEGLHRKLCNQFLFDPCLLW